MSTPKRVRVRSSSSSQPADESVPPSSIRLRPQESQPDRRRSFRIIARGSSDPQPTIIRVTRPRLEEPAPPAPAPPPAQVVHVHPLEFFRNQDIMAPTDNSLSSPLSISSESTERTLSSGSSSSASELELTIEESEGESELEEIGVNYSRRYLDEYARFIQGIVRPQLGSPSGVPDYTDSELSSSLGSEYYSPVAPVRNLLDEPQIIHAMKQHTGRVKCTICGLRISVDHVRIDFRPNTRSAPVKHLHTTCLGRNQVLYFPSDPERDISFGSEFSDLERADLISLLQTQLPSESERNQRGINTPLFPVVRGGDAHMRDIERQRLQADRNRVLQELARNRRQWHPTSAQRYLGSRQMFGARFGLVSSAWDVPAVHRGVLPHILEALPRVTVKSESPAETEEHNCVVCLDPMEEGQTIIILPCFHRFHEKCICGWLNCSKQCPIDKIDVEKLIQDGGDSQAVPSFIQS